VSTAARWHKSGTKTPLAFYDNDRWRGSFELTELDLHLHRRSVSGSSTVWLPTRRRKVTRRDVTSDLLDWARGCSANWRVRSGRRALDAPGGGRDRWATRRRSARAVKLAIDPVLIDLASSCVDPAIVTRYDPQLEVKVTGSGRATAPGTRSSPDRRHGPDAQRHLPMRLNAAIRTSQRWLRRRLHDARSTIGTTKPERAENTPGRRPERSREPVRHRGGAGGHTAIEPALGTLDDFDHFNEVVHEHGMELVMDFALNASPDHPWVEEHPEWFYHRRTATN